MVYYREFTLKFIFAVSCLSLMLDSSCRRIAFYAYMFTNAWRIDKNFTEKLLKILFFNFNLEKNDWNDISIIIYIYSYNIKIFDFSFLKFFTIKFMEIKVFLKLNNNNFLNQFQILHNYFGILYSF